MYFSVGYPLGFEKTNDESWKYRNRIEIKGEYVFLDFVATVVWGFLDANKSENEALKEVEKVLADMDGFSHEPSEVVPKVLEDLVESNLIIHAKSVEELFEKIKDFKIVRSGFPYFDIDVMAELGKHIPTIDDNHVSNLQYSIWREAGAVKTLDEIYNEKFLDISISDFINEIHDLRDKGLLNFYLV